MKNAVVAIGIAVFLTSCSHQNIRSIPRNEIAKVEQDCRGTVKKVRCKYELEFRNGEEISISKSDFDYFAKHDVKVEID